MIWIILSVVYLLGAVFSGMVFYYGNHEDYTFPEFIATIFWPIILVCFILFLSFRGPARLLGRYLQQF